MTRDRSLGLDELMIINPGEADGRVFLGDDGVLYRIRRLADARRGRDPGSHVAPQLLLGDDGMVYQVRGGGSGTQSGTRS